LLPKTLPAAEKVRLQAILARRRPSLLSTLDADELDFEVISELCDVLIDEFSEFGLDSNDEPNVFGLEIEHLIDLIRR
jgi:hypothetical protein